MPTYEITAPNGQTYRIDGPEGATDEQVRAQVLKQFPDAAHRSPSPQSRTTMQELGRQAQLTGRHVVEGLAGIAGLVTNPLNAAIDATFGTNIGSDLQGAAGDTLTRAGVAEPETGLERVVGDASRAVVGASPFVKGGQLLAQGTGKLSQLIGQALAANPASQAGYAAASGASSGATREAGGGQLAQMVAGLGVPLGLSAGGGILRRLVQPITARGQERIAGQILHNQATDPAAARQRIRASIPQVPGSQPTTGSVTGDAGLIGVEKGARGLAPKRFSERISEQNLARQQMLDGIAGTTSDIEAARKSRDLIAGPMREGAFAKAEGAAAPIDNVLTSIDEQLASPAGHREMVRNALGWAKGRLQETDNPIALYEIRKDLRDAMLGKLDKDGSKFSMARKELGAVVQALDDAIEQSAPGFKEYLSRYRSLSEPINQMEILQGVQNRSGLAVPDTATGRDVLSQAKFSRAVNDIMRDPKVASKLTDEQLDVLGRIKADLDIGQAINNPTIRAPGSDTFQNMSFATLLGNPGGRVPEWLKPIERPLRWLYRMSDDKVRELMIEAALDPELADKLLSKADPRSARSVGEALENWLARRVPASTLGLHSAGGSVEE